MKTNIFLSLLVVAMLSTFSLSAANPDKKVYQNIETTESGSIKEMISLKSNNSPDCKTIYYYGAKGELQKKVMYKWSNKGWVNYKKYDYEYNADGLVANLFYTEWDKNWIHGHQNLFNLFMFTMITGSSSP